MTETECFQLSYAGQQVSDCAPLSWLSRAPSAGIITESTAVRSASAQRQWGDGALKGPKIVLEQVSPVNAETHPRGPVASSAVDLVSDGIAPVQRAETTGVAVLKAPKPRGPHEVETY